MVDRATVFGPILKGTEIIDFPIAHILEHLSTQSGATAGRTIEDDYFVFSEILVVIWRFGIGRNSSIPRDTCTAPATLPLFSTSGASRTSTTSVLPLLIISRACAGVMRGTAALATSIICFTLVVMIFLPSITMSAMCQKRTLDQTNGCLSGALDPQVDLAAKRPEIDRLGEKRFSAVLQSFALGVRVAIGGDHDNGDIRSKGLGLG